MPLKVKFIMVFICKKYVIIVISYCYEEEINMGIYIRLLEISDLDEFHNIYIMSILSYEFMEG